MIGRLGGVLEIPRVDWTGLAERYILRIWHCKYYPPPPCDGGAV